MGRQWLKTTLTRIQRRAENKSDKTEPQVKVYSIGHSTRSLQDFIDLLKKNGVERVVDIRTVPRSRHNPQFDRKTLPLALESSSVGYIHLAGLGGLRKPLRTSPNTGWRNASFRGFADYMQTDEFEESLLSLIELAKTSQTAIMCAEAVAWRCHRSLIADALTARGIRVEHIMSSSNSPHKMTRFAKIEGTCLTYPLEQTEGCSSERQNQCWGKATNNW